MPSEASLTKAQRHALAQTIPKVSDLCGPGGVGCKFDVMPSGAGQAVTAQIAYDLTTGECTSVKGGNPVYLYDSTGNFTDQLPGM